MSFIEGIQFIRDNYDEYIESICITYFTWNDISLFDREKSKICYLESKEDNSELIILTDTFANTIMGYQIASRKNKKKWKLDNVCPFDKEKFNSNREKIILPGDLSLEKFDADNKNIPNYFKLNRYELENIKYYTPLSYLSNQEEIKLEVPKFNKEKYDKINFLSQLDCRTEKEEIELINSLN